MQFLMQKYIKRLVRQEDSSFPWDDHHAIRKIDGKPKADKPCNKSHVSTAFKQLVIHYSGLEAKKLFSHNPRPRLYTP